MAKATELIWRIQLDAHFVVEKALKRAETQNLKCHPVFNRPPSGENVALLVISRLGPSGSPENTTTNSRLDSLAALVHWTYIAAVYTEKKKTLEYTK